MTSPFVQTSTLVETTGSASATLKLSAVTAGNALLVLGSLYGPAPTFPSGWSVTTVKTPGGHGYAFAGLIQDVAAGSQSCKITASGSYITAQMYEVPGLAASAIDTTAIGTATGAGTSLTVTGAAATSQASVLGVSVCTYDGENNYSNLGFNPSSGWTQLYVEGNDNTYDPGSAAYQQYSATTTPTITWSGLTADAYGYAGLIVPLLLAAAATSITADGVGTIMPAAAGTAQQLQGAQGSAAIVPSAAGSAHGTNPAAARAIGTPQAAGAAAATQAAAGSGAAQPGASGTAAGAQRAAGASVAQPSAAGDATAAQAAAGTGVIVPLARGAATAANANPAAAIGIMQPSGTGTAHGAQAAAGTAPVSPAAQGTALQWQLARGAGTINPRAIGSVIAAAENRARGGGIVRPGASGAAAAQQSAAGAGITRPAARGAGQNTILAIGRVLIQPIGGGGSTAVIPAVAAGVRAPIGSGTWVAWQSAAGTALIAPSASGTWAQGNTYTTNPAYVLRMPARSFTVAIPPRSFYLAAVVRSFYLGASARSFCLAIPARCFYVESNSAMAAQKFPDTMDPAERQVLTLDGTSDLSIDETLTEIVGSPLVDMDRGSDDTPEARFGTPAINLAAQIAADPPRIPAAIAIGKGVQIPAAQPVDQAAYLVRIPCVTSTGRTVTLKGILQVSSK